MDGLRARSQKLLDRLLAEGPSSPWKEIRFGVLPAVFFIGFVLPQPRVGSRKLGS
jgi:hypothetical protein